MNFESWSGGQFASARGGQFGSAKGGHIKSAVGGQVDRRLHHARIRTLPRLEYRVNTKPSSKSWVKLSELCRVAVSRATDLVILL